ncbi:hypothetical protein BOTNAR_0158g00150 [Botryotinia narcissicola]|uniref:Uncharacterized protein n=1 Tax=Botryotinia narcissicola TaxID=278944 RepID=A0A4Z1IKD6_9HELO|nr:hypothetical protein BOTNAR_0158g00150 [Botryotinia narcissicola]
MFHTCEMQIRGTNMTRKVESPSRGSWYVLHSRNYGATQRMQRLYTCVAVSPGIEMESLARHHELTKYRYNFNKHYDSKSKFDWVHRNLGYEPSAQLLRGPGGNAQQICSAHSELAQSCLSLAFPITQTSLRNLRRNTPLLHAIETQGGDIN